MKSPNSSNDNATPKKKAWHKWLFGLLYLLIVVLLFGLFYNFIVRDERTDTVDENGEAKTGISEYDTLDVIGDYLWRGMKLDDGMKDDEEKTDEKKKQETAAPVIQAEAATEQDIEAATGIATGDAPATPPVDANAGGPKVEQMESPKIEQIESPAK